MDTISWVDDGIELLDQTALPHRVASLRITAVEELVDAIRRLAVRGAPALGVAGGYGVALAAATVPAGQVPQAVAAIRSARPTAVNLARMVDRVAARLPEGAAAVLAEAHAVRAEEVAASVAMGDRGADLVEDLVGAGPVRIVTICNTGGLAAVSRGTALAVAQTLHERGRLGEVIALETRPLLQGARLTTWELARMGAPHRLVVDAAAPFLIARGEADVVLAGADRIAANGDTANKIGTFSLALAARHADIPFIVVAPESTVDDDTPDGAAIPIEDRGPGEVVAFDGHPTAPPGTTTANPAFDVTPARLITAIVTDRRIIRPGGTAGQAGTSGLTAEQVAAHLGLHPLPEEGGRWAQVHRDADSSAIHYLVQPGDFSALHRLDGVEVLHHHAGAPAELVLLGADGGLERRVLGSDLAAGERPTAVVPAGVWQGMRTRGDWSLLGTTMAPPFSEDGFELGRRDDLLASHPQHRDVVLALTRG